ncbi:BglG family transcription antiterminator [Lacrimispora sp. 38-1]|uniref:BglG family transcription antiterminator n=1 Tax=Lacrimispora sp. 38-1 TaxID=3125778 RepID=UPI003CE8DAF2
MDYRLWDVLDILSETEYRTSKYIGEVLGISEKTVRTRIKELEEEISAYGAIIISKPRYGYCLEITELDFWEEYKRKRYEDNSAVPVDSNERIEYMLALLLSRTEYMKIEELCEFLYVSGKTLSNELRHVEYILECFELKLWRKPYYGIRVEGKEFNKRCCILQNFYLSQRTFWGILVKREEETAAIAGILLELAEEYEIRFTETAFQNTVLYVYLSISRMKKGLFITDVILPESAGDVEYEVKISKKIYEMLKPSELTIPETEIYFTGVFIAGKRILEIEKNYTANVVASEKIDCLISKILEEIFLTYNIELRDDLNLRIMLIQHLIPMEIRLKYGIPMENVQVKGVKEKYILAYSMGQLASILLSEYYQKVIQEDEISCIAMYFAMALEEKKMQQKRKNNILLVCISGKASSRMLMYRFQKEFGDYINSLKICGMHELERVDFKQIDFIFTTVPIYKKVSVPIMEIHDFLESSEIMSIKRFLQVGDMQFLNKFYRKELFFSNVPGSSREEVIHEICVRMSRVTELPEGFEESVLQREAFGPTDFGNLTAIPHPCRIMTKETLVAVAVLQDEIKWSSHMVRVVVLTSLKEEKDEDTQKFYEITAKFLSDREAVRSLIEAPDFDGFEKKITALKR